MPVDADGAPHAVPRSPRRAAANRAMFPMPSHGPSWSHLLSGLAARTVFRPLAAARRAVFGRDRRRTSDADAAASDKLV